MKTGKAPHVYGPPVTATWHSSLPQRRPMALRPSLTTGLPFISLFFVLPIKKYCE